MITAPTDFPLQSSGESIAPIIASLVNGFSLFESSIVVLHVRTGTSVFAEMDRDSWRVARLVARVSLVRRQHRLDDDMRNLKEWRCKHSRKCWWCKGYRTATVVDSSGKENPVQSTTLCRPLPSQFYQPLVFVLICSDTTDNVPEQQQLVQMAKANNAYIELRKLTQDETASFLAHCLHINRKYLSFELVHYVHRVSSGIPKYIFLTAKQLVKDGHVVLKERKRKNRAATELLRENTLSFELRYRRLLLQRMGKQYQDLQQEYETPRGKRSRARASEQEASTEQATSDDSSDEDDTEVRYVDDEVIVAVIGLLKTLNQQRIALGLEPDEVFIPNSSADAEQEDWRKQAQYDVLSPSCMPPDAAALELMPPPASVLSAVSLSLDENDDGEPVRSPFYLAECFRRRLVDWGTKDTNKPSEQNKGDHRDSAHVHEEQHPARRFASRRHGRKTNGLGGGSVHCRVGLQEQLAQEDRSRIRRGKLTDAEFALLCFRPSWMPLDFDDLAALRKSRRRRVAQAKHLEWDSDAEEPIVKQGDTGDGGWGIKRYCEARVVSNLNSLPFVPQLVATCMFTVERLLPEEQMMAKVASVFPIAFRPTELRMAYPRRMLSNEFYDLVYQLICKDVLEICEPASQEEQEALSHFIGASSAKTTAQSTVTTAAGNPTKAADGTAAVSEKSGNLLDVPGGGRARHSSVLEDTPFPGLGPGHERRPSVVKAGGIVTPAKVAAAGSGSDAAQQDESSSDSNAARIQRGFEADLAAGCAAGAAWTSVLATPERKEVHIRFTSIALQRVVSDLLLSDERKWLTLVCRRALAQRFVTVAESQVIGKGLAASSSQITAESGSIAQEESEAHDSIPESLLRGVLEAEREQHTRAAEQKQKSSQMEQANVAEAATLQEQHPAVSNSVAESGGVVDAGMPETDLQA